MHNPSKLENRGVVDHVSDWDSTHGSVGQKEEPGRNIEYINFDLGFAVGLPHVFHR